MQTKSIAMTDCGGGCLLQMDADGKTVATATGDLPAVAAGGSATVNMTGLTVKDPTLWDSVPNGGIDTHSYMYSVKVELTSAKGMRGATTDTEVVAFGIRTISFTADGGFQLNGKEMNLQGGCVHRESTASPVFPNRAIDSQCAEDTAGTGCRRSCCCCCHRLLPVVVVVVVALPVCCCCC